MNKLLRLFYIIKGQKNKYLIRNNKVYVIFKQTINNVLLLIFKKINSQKIINNYKNIY